MNKIFTNPNQIKVTFTDEGLSFYSQEQEVFFPYGCLDSLKMSFMGILQATCRTKICSFAVEHKDRAEMKEAIREAHERMATAPEEELRVIRLRTSGKKAAPQELSPAEQLKFYKARFVQGLISREEYEARKRQLKA